MLQGLTPLPSLALSYFLRYFQKSFSESLANPEFVISDFAKFDRPGQLHLAFQVLDRYQQLEGRVPRPYHKQDAAKFIEMARELNSSVECKVRSYY